MKQIFFTFYACLKRYMINDKESYPILSIICKSMKTKYFQDKFLHRRCIGNISIPTVKINMTHMMTHSVVCKTKQICCEYLLKWVRCKLVIIAYIFFQSPYHFSVWHREPPAALILLRHNNIFVIKVFSQNMTQYLWGKSF